MVSVQLEISIACPYFEETSTRMGFTRLALWSFATFVVMVAENKYVVRSVGMTLRIWSMSGPKSMSRRRSASSITYTTVGTGGVRDVGKKRTKNFKFLRLNPFVFWRWSFRRPGVATMTWGRLARPTACCILSIPPTSTKHRAPMAEPRLSNCCAIWYASSRVGARTHANNPFGSSQSFCKIGSANAAVFPDPVSATPMISRPCNAWGSACCWISVGFLKLTFSRASSKGSMRPSSLKVSGGVVDVVASSGEGMILSSSGLRQSYYIKCFSHVNPNLVATCEYHDFHFLYTSTSGLECQIRMSLWHILDMPLFCLQTVGSKCLQPYNPSYRFEAFTGSQPPDQILRLFKNLTLPSFLWILSAMNMRHKYRLLYWKSPCSTFTLWRAR